MAISFVAVAIGMVGFLATCIFGLICGSKMLELLRVTDPGLYSKLQVGAGVQLFLSPSSLESQRFVLGGEYKHHPNLLIQALGRKVHLSSYAAAAFAGIALIGFVVHAVAR